MLSGKKILLGVTGSIAAYKAALLIRLLIKEKAEVKVVMTPLAREFITPLTLATPAATGIIMLILACGRMPTLLRLPRQIQCPKWHMELLIICCLPPIFLHAALSSLHRQWILTCSVIPLPGGILKYSDLLAISFSSLPPVSLRAVLQEKAG